MDWFIVILKLFGGLTVLFAICTLVGNLLKLNDFFKKKK